MDANYYHLHHILFREDIEFWKNFLLRANNIDNGLSLELGCGTGRIFELLSKSEDFPQDLKIFGLDIDSEMLSIAKKNLSNSDQFKFFKKDMLEMNFNNKFSLIYLPCNTFSIFSIYDQKKLLNKVKTLLTPNGYFIFSQPNPYAFKSIPDSDEPESELIIYNEATENPVMVSSEWKSDNQKFYLNWHYDEIFSNGDVSRTTLKTSHYLTSTNEIKKIITESDFTIKNIWGNFDKSKYTKTSENLIIEAGF